MESKAKSLIYNAHQWLREVRAQRNLTYSDIGNFINYSGPGVSKALKNETLSMEQIKVIAIDLGLLEEFNTLFEYIEEGATGHIISGGYGGIP